MLVAVPLHVTGVPLKKADGLGLTFIKTFPFKPEVIALQLASLLAVNTYVELVLGETENVYTFV